MVSCSLDLHNLVYRLEGIVGEGLCGALFFFGSEIIDKSQDTDYLN